MFPPFKQLLQEAGRHQTTGLQCTRLPRTIVTVACSKHCVYKRTLINCKTAPPAHYRTYTMYTKLVHCERGASWPEATAASLHPAPQSSSRHNTFKCSVSPPIPPHTRILGPGGRRVAPLDPGCSSTSQPVNMVLSVAAQVSCLALIGPGLAVWPLVIPVILPEN